MAGKKKKRKICKDCKTDISLRPNNAIYCKSCAFKRIVEYRRLYRKKTKKNNLCKICRTKISFRRRLCDICKKIKKKNKFYNNLYFCPFCRIKLKVINSRIRKTFIYRRKKCLICNYKISTQETIKN